jgi:hypothetical protein
MTGKAARKPPSMEDCAKQLDDVERKNKEPESLSGRAAT